MTLSLLGLLPVATAASGGHEETAYSDRFMVRLAAYSVVNADTDIAVLSDQGIGTGVSFADDLGGDTRVTVPKLDAYYRFAPRHRVDFSHFRLKRNGRKQITIDIEFEDQTYSAGDTVVSSIRYELFRLGYAYSFYHSPQVELSISAGLNVTSYRFEYELADGSSADESDASAPLPMFGLRMAYSINPRWSLHYLAESFFIELDDSLEGAFLNNEVNLQYAGGNNLVLGFGVTRLSIDLTADDDDWRGRITDSHRALQLFIGYRL